MRIDLHTHSAVSDGTDTPAEVIAQAKLAGLDVVALTDHDSTGGWAEAAQAACDSGIALIRGTEFSCRASGIGVHLLSYLHDPNYPPLVDEALRIRQAREDRVRVMVDKLAVDFPITWEEVQAQIGLDATVGRPHIADALVAAEVVPDRTAAFAQILHNRSPYYVRHYATEASHMVELVRAAGGVPVFAHPGAVARQRVVGDSSIARMVEAGLAGLEVFHRDNPPEQRERLLELARRYGLVVTGSSDYHGTGKPNHLGENTTSEQAYADIVAQGALAPIGAGAP